MIRAVVFFLILLSTTARSQQIIEYPTAPRIKTARVGLLNCNLYSQYPAVGQIQVWCTLNGITIYNGISYINSNVSVKCSTVSPQANIAWAFIPGDSGSIGYQLAVQALPNGLPYFFSQLVPSFGVVEKGGIF